MSNLNHSQAKERAQQFSMEHGNSAERFGHKDYYAAKKNGASDADILKQLDANPDTLFSGNAKGSGGLYDQIASGTVPGQTGDNSNSQSNIGNNKQKVTQDNDQKSSIEGHNNYVNQTQDNSVRNYGGDTRVFNYQSSGKSAMDTPVSAATMAGYYAPSNSHAANAARLDRRTTMANDASKFNMNVGHITQGAIKGAAQNTFIDPISIDNRVRSREKASFAAAKVNDANLWGDPDQYEWGGVGEAPKPIEQPDFAAIGKSYTDY